MKSSAFSYHRPETAAQLIALLAELPDAKLLAGGQSLVPMLNLRLVAPENLIDINRVAELSGVAMAGEILRIGALTRQAELLKHPVLSDWAPVFGAALHHVGHIQTRSRGTIGGSCCHLDPAAELPALCALHDAVFEVSGPRGARHVAAKDWFQGMLQSALAEDEVLLSISFKPWAKGHGHGFSEYARRHGDFAIAGAAALIEADGQGTISRAALVVFGVEAAPARLFAAEHALTGRPVQDLDLTPVLEAANALDALADVHVSAAYRRHLGTVNAKRAVLGALSHLTGDQS